MIKTIIRSCGNYKNHNQVLWHTLGQFPQSRLGRLHDCPRFQKVSANLTIFEIQIFNFLVVAGPLPCWRSVIDTFLPTQSSSLIGQSLMLRPILNNVICFFLRYESSPLILCNELSSSIFQSLSGMRDTLPDLHFVQYIKS